jgi:hypothetical protein
LKGRELNGKVAEALEAGGIVDISTTGRRSGRAHRIEMVFHHFDGEFFMTGRPGKRDWYANMLADPRFTLHLKRGVQADLDAVAEPVTDEDERGPLLLKILVDGFRVAEDEARDRLPLWVSGAPLVRFTVS